MAELYEGQAAVIAAKMEQARLLQASDADEVQASTDPRFRAGIQRRMASRITLIAGMKRQLDSASVGAEDDGPTGDARNITVRVRINAEEDAKLRAQAADQGVGISEYIRMMCGL